MYILKIYRPFMIPVPHQDRLRDALSNNTLEIPGFPKSLRGKYLDEDRGAEVRYNRDVGAVVIDSLPYVFVHPRVDGGDVRLTLRPSGIGAISVAFSYSKLPSDLSTWFRTVPEKVLRQISLNDIRNSLKEQLGCTSLTFSSHTFDVVIGFTDTLDSDSSLLIQNLDSRGLKYGVRKTNNTWRCYSKPFFALLTSLQKNKNRNSLKAMRRRISAKISHAIELALGIHELVIHPKNLLNIPHSLSESHFVSILHELNPFVLSGRINVPPPNSSLVRTSFISVSAPLRLRRKFRDALVNYVKKMNLVNECLSLIDALNSLPVYSNSSLLLPLSPSRKKKRGRTQQDILNILDRHFAYHVGQVPEGLSKEEEMAFKYRSGVMISALCTLLGKHPTYNEAIRGELDKLIAAGLVKETKATGPGRGKKKAFYSISIDNTGMKKYLIDAINEKMNQREDTPEDYGF